MGPNAGSTHGLPVPQPLKSFEKVPDGAGILTTPEEAKHFVAAAGVDILAPAVGNMHGLFQTMVTGAVKKRLDIERIAAIRDAASVFMTLHGGSGTDDDDFKKAIKARMTIVHVNTEIRLAWRRAMEAVLAADQSVVPYKLMVPVVVPIQKVVHARLRLFSSR